MIIVLDFISQATLLAITKMMCMKQQKSKLVEDFEDMTSDRVVPNIEKFTKAVHTRFKSQNVFLEYTHYGRHILFHIIYDFYFDSI